MVGEILLDINKIEQSLAKRAETLEPLSGNCCIYKAPPSLRGQNKDKFTPQILSIGPFHHGKVELKPMEEHKCRYLFAFLRRINMSLSEYIKELKDLEIRLRESYVEIDGFDREEFMEIMATDGAFVMEYLLRYYYRERETSDRIFGRQSLVIEVTDDLLLIENQLPFFYLEHLFRLFKKSETNLQLTLEDIVKLVIQKSIGIWQWSNTEDIITDGGEVHHLLHFLIICLKKSPRNDKRKCTSLSTPTISELHRAGAKFKPSPTHCLCSINFANGFLEIPKLILTDDVEKIFRNMQAFEYCHNLDYYVGDYIFFMDMLINNEEDIEVLVKSGIIENWLENNHVAAAMFNNLGKGTYINTNKFSYVSVTEDLNAYYKIKRHKWKAMLKQKYFNNPWTIISVVAAVFLLLLATIQTVCSVLQVI